MLIEDEHLRKFLQLVGSAQLFNAYVFIVLPMLVFLVLFLPSVPRSYGFEIRSRHRAGFWVAVSFLCLFLWLIVGPCLWFYQFSVDERYRSNLAEGIALWRILVDSIARSEREFFYLCLVYVAPWVLALLSLFRTDGYFRRYFQLEELPSHLDYIAQRTRDLTLRIGVKLPTLLFSKSRCESPFVYRASLGKPTLVVPQNLEAVLGSVCSTESERSALLDFILTHELCHIKSGDVSYATWSARLIRMTRHWWGFVLLLPLFVHIREPGLVIGYSAFVLLCYCGFLLCYQAYATRREIIADLDALRTLNSDVQLRQLAQKSLLHFALASSVSQEDTKRARIYNPIALIFAILGVLGPSFAKLRDTLTGPTRPTFVFLDLEFWINGIGYGLLIWVVVRNIEELLKKGRSWLRNIRFNVGPLLADALDPARVRLIAEGTQMKERLIALRATSGNDSFLSPATFGAGIGLLVPLFAISAHASMVFTNWLGWISQGKVPTIGTGDSGSAVDFANLKFWLEILSYLVYWGAPTVLLCLAFLPEISAEARRRIPWRTLAVAFPVAFGTTSALLSAVSLFDRYFRDIYPGATNLLSSLMGWNLPLQTIQQVVSYTLNVYVSALVSVFVLWAYRSLRAQIAAPGLPTAHFLLLVPCIVVCPFIGATALFRILLPPYVFLVLVETGRFWSICLVITIAVLSAHLLISRLRFFRKTASPGAS